MPLPDITYTIDESGQIYRTKHFKLHDADRWLSEFANQRGICVPKAFPSPAWLPPGTIDHAGLRARTGGGIFVWCRILKLSMRAQFDIEHDLRLPRFRGGGTSMEMTLDYLPPQEMALFLAVDAKLTGSAYKSQSHLLFACDWRTCTPGAGAVPQESSGFFKLPLPNTYSDGRICLGRGNESVQAPSAAELLARTHTILQNSVWNQDLSEQVENSRQLFRWDAATATQRPPTLRWYQLCSRVSHPLMKEILP